MGDKVSLTAVLLGGALALAGTVTSQVFGLLSGFIDRRHQRDLRQRERLEKIVDLVSASLAWFQRLPNCRTIEDLRTAQPPPEARQAVMLAHLYFPSLVAPAANYLNGLIRYYHFATACFQNEHPGTLGAKMVIVASSNPVAKQSEQEPLMLRQALDDAIAEEAKRYYHA